jgi:saccharopine dehydrogenase-like NADP-dependent oxidoreductase
MTNRVLILGGRGRIGSSVAIDLLNHTQAQLTITGKSEATQRLKVAAFPAERVIFLQLDLSDLQAVGAAIRNLASDSTSVSPNLVIHCAGPFHHRDQAVLKLCIEYGLNYLDVSDSVDFTQKLLGCHQAAVAAGVMAIVNSGIFPGISNSMVRQGIEHLDKAEQIHLSYVVSGSGGAGLTVMRTTFLGLINPFKAWLDGQWQMVNPYSQRELIQLPAPYGRVHVYWFEMPETLTLVDSFPVKTVVTKFGSIPDFYNYLTWIAAHVFPKSWIKSPIGTEFLARVSYRMTGVTDRFSGIGVGIRSEVTGQKDGQTCKYVSTLVHENTAIAAGAGTGSIAQLLLSGQLHTPGVYPVEQALPTDLFEQAMQSRGLAIAKSFEL